MRARRPPWHALAAACAASCAREDVVGVIDRGDSAAAGLDARAPNDTGPPVTREQFCAGTGGTGVTGTDCHGRVAARVFRYALCTCDGYVSSHALTTDSFDSTAGGYQPGGRGGSVGTNGGLSAGGALAVGGSLRAGGADGLTVSGGLTVLGELRCNGRMVSDYLATRVETGAWIRGDVQTRDLSVRPTLTVPAEYAVQISGARDVAREVREPVAVLPPPCDCDPALLTDVAGIVAAHRDANDNAAAALDPAGLANVTAPLELALPCGRYYVDRIGTTASVTLVMSGRTALYVGGDVSLGGPFTVRVMSGGEIDVFVAGNVVASAALTLGSVDHPAQTRLYVGGTGTVNLSHTAVLAGNLYAPRAELVLAADAQIYGGVFARRLAAGGALAIHYDTAVLAVGRGCAVPASGDAGAPTRCESCRDCDNQACLAGACGACTDSAQCCAPLLCDRGRCVPEAPP